MLSLPENRPASPKMCKTGQEEPLGARWTHWGGCTEPLGGVCSTRSPPAWVHWQLCPGWHHWSTVHDSCKQPQQQSCPWCLHTPGVPMGTTLCPHRGDLAGLPHSVLCHGPPGTLCAGPAARVSELLGKSFWRLQPGALRKTGSETVFLKIQQLWITFPKLGREETISASQWRLHSLFQPPGLCDTHIYKLSHGEWESKHHIFTWRQTCALPWLLPGLVHAQGWVLHPSAWHSDLSSVSVPWYNRRGWRPRVSSRTAQALWLPLPSFRLTW